MSPFAAGAFGPRDLSAADPVGRGLPGQQVIKTGGPHVVGQRQFIQAFATLGALVLAARSRLVPSAPVTVNVNGERDLVVSPGGKLLGAGGGGFLMVMAPPHKHAAIRKAVGAPRELPFRIDRRGSRVIFISDRYAF